MKSTARGLKEEYPAAPSRPSVFRLTPREKAVASHLGDDMEPAEIGKALGIKANTVRVYVRNIYQKMGSAPGTPPSPASSNKASR